MASRLFVLDMPLKLADNYNIANVIERDSVPLRPGVRLNLHEFVEVVFQNTENELQSDSLSLTHLIISLSLTHLIISLTPSGMAMANGLRCRGRPTTWSTRKQGIQLRYCNLEVYPNGWSATLVSLDNQGMWNLRSAIWDRQYLASSSTSGSGCHSRASPMTTASLPMPFSVAGPPAFHTDEQDEDLSIRHTNRTPQADDVQ
nr:unnamed protein product [Digitaria exilis]